MIILLGIQIIYSYQPGLLWYKIKDKNTLINKIYDLNYFPNLFNQNQCYLVKYETTNVNALNSIWSFNITDVSNTQTIKFALLANQSGKVIFDYQSSTAFENIGG